MAISFASMGVPLGIGIAPPLLTAFVDEFGWRAGWRVLAIGAWLLLYPVAMMMRRQPEDYGLHPDGKSDEEVRAGGGAMAEADYANSFTRREALRTPALYLTVLAFGLSSVALGAMLMQSIPFLTDEGFDRGVAALMMTAYAITSWAGKPAWGFLLDRTTPRYLAAFAFASQGVAVLVIMLGATAGSLPLVAGGFLLFGVGGGGAVPLQEVIWASYFGRRYLGAVRGVGMPLSLTISASAPIGVSYYFDTVGNYHGAFFAVAALTMLAAFIIMLSRKPQKPRPRPEPDTRPLTPTAAGAGSDGPPDVPAPTPTAAGAGGRDDGAPVEASAQPVAAASEERRGPRDYMNGSR